MTNKTYEQIAEFIEWKLEIDKGNEDELAVIISEANTKHLINLLSKISLEPFRFSHDFVMESIMILDWHLEKEGLYKIMAEDKQDSDLKQGALTAHMEFMES